MGPPPAFPRFLVFQAFCDLVEMLLESHLAEIGISPEDFVEICMKAKNSRQLNTQVVEQILAVEDFLSALYCVLIVAAWLLTALTARVFRAAFKKLMIKRNLELEAEALECDLWIFWCSCCCWFSCVYCFARVFRALNQNDGALNNEGVDV
jgi:hypothetical protein